MSQPDEPAGPVAAAEESAGEAPALGEPALTVAAGAPQLSRAEIEALAQGQRSRGAGAGVTGRYPTVKEYDFRQPERLSREQIRTLQMLHESFARLGGVAASAILRTNVQVTLTSLEQIQYEAYMQRLPEQGIFHIVRLDPLPGDMVLEFEIELGLNILERLAGGAGIGLSGTVHELTDIEVALLGRLARSLLDSYRDAWINVISLEPRLENTVLLPMFAQIALPSDVIVLTTFDVRVGETVGLLRVCLPFSTIEPVVENLSAQVWFSRAPRAGQQEAEAQVAERLTHVGVPITVELGSTAISIRDLLELRAGDVVRLDSRCDRPVGLLVNSRLKYVGAPGRARNRLAIKITSSVPETEEE